MLHMLSYSPRDGRTFVHLSFGSMIRHTILFVILGGQLVVVEKSESWCILQLISPLSLTSNPYLIGLLLHIVFTIAQTAMNSTHNS